LTTAKQSKARSGKRTQQSNRTQGSKAHQSKTGEVNLNR